MFLLYSLSSLLISPVLIASKIYPDRFYYVKAYVLGNLFDGLALAWQYSRQEVTEKDILRPVGQIDES